LFDIDRYFSDTASVSSGIQTKGKQASARLAKKKGGAKSLSALVAQRLPRQRPKSSRIAALEAELMRLINGAEKVEGVEELYAASMTAVSHAAAQVKEQEGDKASLYSLFVNELSAKLDADLSEMALPEMRMPQNVLHGVVRQYEIIRERGPYLTLKEAADQLGISPQAVHKKLQTGKLFALKLKDELNIPGWQIKDGELLKGLPETLEALGEMTNLGRLIFFTSPNPVLDDRTPLEALRKGSVERVLDTAVGYREQGAR
jgi:hypothetical protein